MRFGFLLFNGQAVALFWYVIYNQQLLIDRLIDSTSKVIAIWVGSLRYPATELPVLRLPMGKRGNKMGAHVPKAQGLKRHGLGPRPCNTEGARGIWQTNKLSAHYSKIYTLRNVLCRWLWARSISSPPSSSSSSSVAASAAAAAADQAVGWRCCLLPLRLARQWRWWWW